MEGIAIQYYKNELVDAQLEQPQAVEPIEEIPVVDDVALIVINEEEKKAEIEGVEVDVDAENIQLIQDLKLLDTLLKDLLTAINNLGDTSIITGEIVDLDNRTGALNMSAKGKDPEIQTLLRAIQSKYNKERKKAIDKAKNELLIEILVEEKKELDVRLSKALLAIAKIGEQQYNDGLVENRELTPESQLTTESALISDAFDEIGEEIRDNGEVSNDVINTIKDLFDIISRDAQDIIVNVLTNTISEGNVFDLSFVPTRVATGLFIRFLSRVLYSGTEYNDRQGDSMVEGFLNHGGRLEGQNQGVVNRLANALRVVIPRAPRPPLRRPFPALLAGGGVRGLPVEEKSSGLMDEFNRELMDEFNRELMQDLETVEEQKVGTFKNLLDKLEKGTEKLAKTGPSVETRDMSDDEFEEQLAEMEDLESNLGVFARAHATATIGRSQAESIRNFASSKIPNFNIPVNAVRNSFRNAPNEIPNILRGVARAVAPIYRRQPGQIRGGRMVHIIMGVLLSAIYSAVFLSTQEGQQEREAGTTEQQTLEQERETDTTEAKRGTTTEFVKGEEKEVRPEDIDTPAGIGLLRADFEMVGIDFFNKQFATTTLDMENSEWAEFSFVPNIDTQNNIEIDNSFGESVRFREPMFMPKYQPKLKPPSQLAINMGRDRMTPAIQLSQGFAPKFSGAVNVYDNLSYTLNNDAFSRSWEDNKLYHPDNSI